MGSMPRQAVHFVYFVCFVVNLCVVGSGGPRAKGKKYPPIETWVVGPRLGGITTIIMKSSCKYLIVALGAALLSLPSLQAEEKSTGGPADGQREMRREKMGERMAEELNLTAEQQAKFKELNQQEKAELEALRAGVAANKEALRAQAQAIHQKYREQRHALMTPEQRTKADAMRGKMEKRKDRMERREKTGT
jgi:protein CpxP